MDNENTLPVFGQQVKCTEYVKRSGNAYELRPAKHFEDDFPECYFWAAGSEKGVEVEDFHECERFNTVKQNFTGIFVGVTTLNTKITVEYYEDGYTMPYFRTQTTTPEKFAVVYYSSNKKRLVPLSAIHVLDGKTEKKKGCKNNEK